MQDQPWEHPDWYDLHDRACIAGPEREPEHYHELLLSLPPLDRKDHLVDLGAGTGKVASMVATAYPELGRLSLVEPNGAKLRRAKRRLGEQLPEGRVEALQAGLGEGELGIEEKADVVTIGSVLMVCLEIHDGTLADSLSWLDRGLSQIADLLHPGGALHLAETMAVPWAKGGPNEPSRRLRLPELRARIEQAGFCELECTYRFRDRVVLKALRAED